MLHIRPSLTQDVIGAIIPTGNGHTQRRITGSVGYINRPFS